MLHIIPTTFLCGAQYRAKFKPVIDAEEEAQKKKENQVIWTGIRIKWSTKCYKKVASFKVCKTVSLGSSIKIEHPIDSFHAIAVITDIKSSKASCNTIEAEVICPMIDDSSNLPPSGSKDYTVKPVFDPIVYKRWKDAINKFSNNENGIISDNLSSILLGIPTSAQELGGVIPDNLAVPGLPGLNASQEKAVRSVLRSPLSLIQGPPGTGKTLTTASLVYHMKSMYNDQILVCAPSNVAVDHLADIISRTGLNVVRMVVKSRENLRSSVSHICLHVLANEVAMRSGNKQLRDLFLIKKATYLSHEDNIKYDELYGIVEHDLLSSADIVCVTCSTAADKRLNDLKFRHVIIDESTQSAEPDTIVPVVKGAKQLCLIGDQCQLGPVVTLRAAATAGLARSLFERLMKMGHRPHRLEIQYRMHPFLSEFSSKSFYEGALRNGVSAEERHSRKVYTWPNPMKPLLFYNSVGPEEIGRSKSVSNHTEAAIVEKFVSFFIKNGAMGSEIGVITPYEAQRTFLLQHLARNGSTAYDAVEVASVDSFQGLEKEFIIFSCVRSNERNDIGFLKDKRRLNVALTRARRGVVVIGNVIVFAMDTVWRSFILHCLSNGLVVGGPIQKPEPLDIVLPSLSDGNKRKKNRAA